MTDEYVIFNGHAFTNEGMARNLAAFSHARILLDLDKGANFSFVADFAAIKIDELGKFDISPQLYVGSDT